MSYEVVFGQPPWSIIIPEPGMIDEEQLDENRDAGIDEVVKEEKECNGDEPSSMVNTEDLKQDTCNEDDKNELPNSEISKQQQVKRLYSHNYIYF